MEESKGKEAFPAIASITHHHRGWWSLPESLSGAKPHLRVFLLLLAAEKREKSLHGQRELLQMSFITFILKKEQDKGTLNHFLDEQ